MRRLGSAERPQQSKRYYDGRANRNAFSRSRFLVDRAAHGKPLENSFRIVGGILNILTAVKAHRSKVMEKSGADSLPALVRLAENAEIALPD